jgi:glycosyltransferase involved in cell wall biosynthesis
MKVSIITVCYNSGQTIAQTLKSVASQTYPDIEYIVIDGRSKDNTLEVIKEHGSRVAILVSEKDRGIYDAMNKAIALATGDVIGFINADDFYASDNAVAIAVKALQQSGADSCYGDLCYVEQNDTNKIVRYWKSNPFEGGLFEKGWCPPHPTFFVKRSVYLAHGGFNLQYSIAADVELMARFLVTHKITSCYVPQVLIEMRMGGTTNRNLYNIIIQNREIRRALRSLGLKFSWPTFLYFKVASRLTQYVRRPV